MKEIYHDTLNTSNNTADIPHKIEGILDIYKAELGWKIGRISTRTYETRKGEPTTTEMSIPIAQYDEPVVEATKSFLVGPGEADVKISSLDQLGYINFQRIKVYEKEIIVAEKPFIKQHESR